MCVQDKERGKMSVCLSYVSITPVRSVNLTLVMFAGKKATNYHPAQKNGNNKKIKLFFKQLSSSIRLLNLIASGCQLHSGEQTVHCQFHPVGLSINFQ